MAVNGDPCRRRWWLGEWRFPTLLAGGSGQNPVLVEEATTTKLSPSLDDDEGEWRWPATASRDGEVRRVKQRQR
jgi:hypothetical protein